MKKIKDFTSRWNMKFDMKEPFPSDEEIKKRVRSLSDPTYIFELIK